MNFNARNTEIYLGTIAVLENFKPADKGNDVTLAAYMDARIIADDITNWTKISSELTEISIEPGEDEAETRLFFGSTSDGAQNSEVISTTNADLEISLTADAQLEETIASFALNESTDTHASVEDYQLFNLGNASTDDIVMFIRVKKQIGTNFYYKNYLIKQPIFTQAGEPNGSADDPALSIEYNILGTKSKAWKEFYYTETTAEDLTNL